MGKSAKKKKDKTKPKTAKTVKKVPKVAKIKATAKAAAPKVKAAAVKPVKGMGLLQKALGKVASKLMPPTKGAKGVPVQAAAPTPAVGKGKGAKGAAKTDKKAEALAQLLIPKEEDVVLTNADGKEYCRVHDCDNEATTDGHCRFHYLALWKRNRIKAKILQGGKLDKYIEDLTSKYPDKYLEMLRKDLASEKDFNLIVAEMDVEDGGDEAEQEEETNRFIEEVRGGIPTPDDDEGGF
jgi:hypothetical protein